MTETRVVCPNCNTSIRINFEQPRMPFVMGGGRDAEFRCDWCGNTQSHTGKCEKCSQKRWGLA